MKTEAATVADGVDVGDASVEVAMAQRIRS
jgi:hypothetical protein